MRLIDVDHFIKTLNNCMVNHESHVWRKTAETMIFMVEVEWKFAGLTRCRDCKYNRNAIGSYVHCDILPQMYGRKPEDNYCSYAERRPDK